MLAPAGQARAPFVEKVRKVATNPRRGLSAAISNGITTAN
jgi:hypothetical protein